MTLPHGVTEQQLLDAISHTVRLLSQQFSFGIYSRDDIAQEIGLEVVRVLDRYDPQSDEHGNPTRPLENFIFTVSRHRLIRLKRDKLRRTDSPCDICSRAAGNRTDHDDGKLCPKFVAWKRRQDAKSGLMRPLPLDLAPAEEQRNTRTASDVAEQAEVDDMLARIDEHLDVELRSTYLQMRAGKSVPKARRVAVEQAVREILGDTLET